MDLSKIKPGDVIEYTGDSWAYDAGCPYTVYTAEETYTDVKKMPEYEKGQLYIVHLTNSDNPLFLNVKHLNAEEWKFRE